MAGDTVQQIKDKLSIQDIVVPYVKLTRAGKSLVGLCPFHKEKTGSFHVSLERGTWHCFGCGLGGDGFSFIEKIENVDFKGALKILADKAGVTIEYDNSSRERSSRTERLREVMNQASEWYAGKLLGSPAEAYAKKRNISDDTIRDWRLGYAPDAWRALLEALTEKGFTIEELLGAGLIKEADGKAGTYYDRFRNRLMFPIRDSAGRVVAFTGRALSADDQAKYLNSPETELYHKSEILFGMDKAKDAIRMRKFTMLVEGQIDVLLAHQAGFGNAVALSGTALSEKHLTLMKRSSENLMLVLDADRAGIIASARSVQLSLRADFSVKITTLPDGMDPADLISKDKKLFAACITEARPAIDFFLISLRKIANGRQLTHMIQEIVFPLIESIPNPIEKDRAIQRTALELGSSAESVRGLLKNVSKFSEVQRSTTIIRKDASYSVRSAADIRGEQLLAVVQVYPDTPVANRVKMEYCRITEAEQFPSDALPEPVLFKVGQTFGEEPSDDAADELLNAFEEAVIREAYQEAVTNLRKAEAGGDAASIASAQTVCAKLSTRLATFG